MKVAIVGATGFLGSNFVRHAVAKRPDTTVLAVQRPAHPRVAGPNVVPIAMDLDGGEAVRLDADVAIYCAGVSDHGLGFGKIADSAARLARFLDGFRGRLILMSSGAVYFDSRKGPVAEDAVLAPTMPYGIAKRLEEQVAEGAAASGRLNSLTILRLFYSYGPGERRTRLVRRAIDLAAAGGGDIEIPEGAPSTIHPVYVDELAGWIFRLADAPARGVDVLNMAGPAALPIDLVIAEIARVLGAELRVKRTPRSEPYPVHYWSNDARQRARGFVPAPLPAMIEAYAAAVKADAVG